MAGKEYKLVEICDLITCGVAKRPEYFENGIPFLSSKNVKKNKIFFKDYNCISQEMHNELTKKNKPQRGDILYTRVGSFGEAAVIDFDEEFSVFVSLTLIKPKKKIVDAYYLMQFLNSEIVQALAKRSTIGNGVQNLNVNTVREFKIVLPSLSDQIQIANILSKAETLIEQRKQSITLLDEFTNSIFREMFGDPIRNEKGWKLEKLGLITSMKSGEFVAAADINSEFRKELFPCYGGNGLRGYTKSFTHNGEFVLIGRQGALCGNVKVAKGMFHATEHAVVCSQIMNYETSWLYYLLEIVNLNKYATGVAQPGLAVGKLEQIEIIFPPIELQTQFASIVTKTETLKEQYKNSLAELESLYGALSQQAFKGELVMKEQTL